MLSGALLSLVRRPLKSFDQPVAGLLMEMLAACLISAAITYFSVEIAWRRYLRNFLGSGANSARSPATQPREISRA